MGMSVDAYAYKAHAVVDSFEKQGADNPELLRKIMEACGNFIDDSYVIMYNELWSDGNPAWKLGQLLDSAFTHKPLEVSEWDQEFEIPCHGEHKIDRIEIINYVEDYEVAEALGFELKEEDE